MQSRQTQTGLKSLKSFSSEYGYELNRIENDQDFHTKTRWVTSVSQAEIRK